MVPVQCTNKVIQMFQNTIQFMNGYSISSDDSYLAVKQGTKVLYEYSVE